MVLIVRIVYIVLIASLMLGIGYVFSSPLYLNVNECYTVNPNLTICSMNNTYVVQNMSYNCTDCICDNDCGNFSYNLTCPEYNFTSKIDEINGYLSKMSLVTDNLTGITDTFNLTAQYSEAHTNWEICTNEIQECFNNVEELEDLDEQLELCKENSKVYNEEVSVLSGRISEVQDNQWLWTLGALGVGIGGTLFFTKKRDFDDTKNLDTGFAEGVPHNRFALNKHVRDTNRRSRLEEEIKSLENRKKELEGDDSHGRRKS